MPSFRKLAAQRVNALIAPLGVELVRRNRADFAHYIPFGATLAAARQAGLSVGDYIDERYNVPGATQDTIDRMAALGVFLKPLERICEIGPGSGRYLERTLRRARPTRYEVYETARDWRAWLEREYGVTAHDCDGASLRHTPSDSVDLIHAHKVLPGLPIFTTSGYFAEMARVVKAGGMIVFDVLTEACLTDEYLGRWLPGHQWPLSMIPKAFAVDFFARRGFRLIGGFFIPMVPGITEYLCFQRQEG